MREQLTWNILDCNTVEGFGINITYHFTTFDQEEFDEFKKWCKKHIQSGLIIDNVTFPKEDLYL